MVDPIITFLQMRKPSLRGSHLAQVKQLVNIKDRINIPTNFQDIGLMNYGYKKTDFTKNELELAHINKHLSFLLIWRGYIFF